jgi:5-methylcytosine-specific restriction protein A
VTPGEVVDHIKELKDGGDPWDVDNLMTLCKSCHAKKTGEEVKKRSRNKGFRSISDF